LLQVLSAFAHGDLTLQEAVDRPRLHVAHLEDSDADGSARVEAEEDLPLPKNLLPALAVRRHHPHSMYFGGVAAALRSQSGQLEAAADPRRAGAVALSP